MSRKPKVLLTTAYGPFELEGGENINDLFTSRLTRGQGVFSLTSHCHCFGLYLIAENISCPTVVLENPHGNEFEAELDNNYDYIGFQLKSIYTDKIADMVELVKRKSPSSKIVIGGYGVSTLSDPVPGDMRGSAKFILQNADYFCREEGCRFMRRILDDEPLDRPITQYHLPFVGFATKVLRRWHFRVPIILVSLGCPNACTFCSTSSFFHHKKIRVADPEQIYHFMKNYSRRLRTKYLFTILFDEDFFENPDYVRELGRLIRGDKKTWNYKWIAFGSIRGLSQFNPEELRDCGLDAVWVGVESLICDDPTQAGKDYFPKRYGDVEKVLNGLHKNGIHTVASLMLGFDFHTPENIERDIDYFVKLKPAFYQIGPLMPCPGTELYDRLKKEDRLHSDYQWKDSHLWEYDSFKYKNFERNEIKQYADLAHKRLVEENGPPILSVMEIHLDAYKSLEGKTGKFYQGMRNYYKTGASFLCSIIKPIMEYGASELVRKRAADLRYRYFKMFGREPIALWGAGKLYKWSVDKAMSRLPETVVSDPPARWTYYNHDPHSNQIYIRKGHGTTRIKKRRDKSFFIG